MSEPPQSRQLSALAIRYPARILSDLHLGHSGCAVASVDALKPLLDGVETLIFNGDTLEERAEAFRQRSERLVGQLKALCESAGVQPVFVTGNHDPQLSDLHHLDLLGGDLLVTHGDTLFELISPWSKKIDDSREAIERIKQEYTPESLKNLETRLEFTKRAGLEMSVFESELDRGVWAKFSTLVAELWPPSRPTAILSAWASASRRAFALMETCRPEASLMVFGHTHLPGIWKKRGRTVVNTGGFLALCHARAVDISIDGRVTVHKIARKKEQLHIVPKGVCVRESTVQ